MFDVFVPQGKSQSLFPNNLTRINYLGSPYLLPYLVPWPEPQSPDTGVPACSSSQVTPHPRLQRVPPEAPGRPAGSGGQVRGKILREHAPCPLPCTLPSAPTVAPQKGLLMPRAKDPVLRNLSPNSLQKPVSGLNIRHRHNCLY